jgi:hypothetical protein
MRIETPGGGGYGPPAERALDALAADLRSGKVSRKAAERDYGKARVASALKLLPPSYLPPYAGERDTGVRPNDDLS